MADGWSKVRSDFESRPSLQLFDSSHFPGGEVRTLFLKMR
jgi:hypothetical protein